MSLIGKNINQVPLNQFLGKLAFQDELAFNGSNSSIPTVASASTITITKKTSFVSGTTTITTINVPTSPYIGSNEITIIPTGAWSMSTSGNISSPLTATINIPLTLTYDATSQKWYPQGGYLPKYGIFSAGAQPFADTATGLSIGTAMSGSATQNAVNIYTNVQSDVTTVARGYISQIGTAAASFTLPVLQHYVASQLAIGSGSTVTNQYGFTAGPSLSGATYNYGFYGDLASSTNSYNLYMNGTAKNFLNGSLGIGTTTPGEKLEVVGNASVIGTDASTRIYVSNTSSTASRWPGLQSMNCSNVGGFPVVELIQTRGTSATPTSVLANDVLGGFNTWGHNGTGNISATRIQGYAESTFSSSVDAGLTFFTTAAGTQAERMRIDKNGNVGIGHTSPSSWYTLAAKLLVNNSQDTVTILGIGNATSGATAATALKMIGGTANSHHTSQLNDNSGSPYFLYDWGSGVNYTKWTIAGSEKMRLDSSGNLGIGTTPSVKLHVQPAALTGTIGDQQIGLRFNFSNVGANLTLLDISSFRDGTGTDWATAGIRTQVKTDTTWQSWQQFNGNGNQYGMAWGTGSSTSNPQSVTEKMRLDSSGNLGIGVITPAGGSRLTVAGDIGMSGPYGLVSNLYYASGWKYHSNGYGGAAYPIMTDGAFVLYRAGNNTSGAGASATLTENMRIDASGNAGFGTTTPASRMHIRQDQDGTTALTIQNRNGPGTPIAAINFVSGAQDLSNNRFSSISSGGGTATNLSFKTSNGAAPTEKMAIDSTGIVTINSGQLYMGDSSISTGGSFIELGSGRTGDGYAYIDLHTSSGTDYNLRLIHDPGINGVGQLTCTGTGGLILQTENAAPIKFATNSVTAMTIDSSGKVGIGTSSPNSKLQVVSASALTGDVLQLTSTGIQYTGIAMFNTYISASQNGTEYVDFRNENGIPVSSLVSDFNGDGSSAVYVTTTKAGARTTDRRIERLRIDWNGVLSTSDAGVTAWGFLTRSAGLTNDSGFWHDASNNYQVALRNSSGTLNAVITSSGNSYLNGGNVGIGTSTPGYLLHVNGSFAATTKSFVIDHPTKPDMKLRYGSLEGPENGVYVRGRLTDSKVIKLPDYWTELVDESTITVNLTAIGKSQDLYVEDIVDNTVIVGGENINCFYTVFAERKDVDKLVVEFENE